MEENEREKGDAKEFARLVEQSEQAWKSTKKELQTINIGTRQNERELKIENLITVSKKNFDLTTTRVYWCVCLVYVDMHGLDTNIAVHKVLLK
jgi:hypothetical protein